MTGTSRTTSSASLISALLVVSLTACSDDSTPAANGTPVPAAPAMSAAPATAVPTSAASAAAATSAAAAPGTIAISYAGGKVTGATERTRVKLGGTVTVNVTSDVADEVHLHGYDKSVDVAAGDTATLIFTANIPGIFEMELENTGAVLARLQVQ